MAPSTFDIRRGSESRGDKTFTCDVAEWREGCGGGKNEPSLDFRMQKKITLSSKSLLSRARICMSFDIGVLPTCVSWRAFFRWVRSSFSALCPLKSRHSDRATAFVSRLVSLCNAKNVNPKRVVLCSTVGLFDRKSYKLTFFVTFLPTNSVTLLCLTVRSKLRIQEERFVATDCIKHDVCLTSLNIEQWE